jgi:putative inorganic carbon (HCO3(-)) transporter
MAPGNSSGAMRTASAPGACRSRTPDADGAPEILMLKYLSIAAIILLLFWLSFFPRPVQNEWPLVTRVGLALAVAVLLLEKRGRIFSRSDWPVLIFALSLVPGAFASGLAPLSVRICLDLVLSAVLVYYLVSGTVSDPRVFKLAAVALCLMSAAVALGGLAEVLLGENPLYRHVLENPYYKGYIAGIARPMSTQFNPAALGGYLLASLPFHILLFREAPSNRTRWLTGISSGLVALVLVLTFSRGACLGLLASWMFYLWFTDRRRKALVYALLALLLVAVASVPNSPLRRLGLHYLGRGGAVSQYRINRAVIAWRMLRDNPVAGVGFEQYRNRFDEYDRREEFTPNENMIADNMYLTLLAETGLSGTAGFVVLAGWLLINAGRRLRRNRHPPPAALRLALCTMALLGLLVDMAGYELFYWPNQYLHLMVVVGCMAALFRVVPPVEPGPPAGWTRAQDA